MRAYSLDLRQRVMKAYDEGKWTVGQIAERFKVGPWWVHKLKRQRQLGAGIAPRKGLVGQPRRLGPEQINRLTAYVDKHPDATLEQIHEKIAAACTSVTIHNTLRRLGYRFKKKRCGPANKIALTSGASASSGARSRSSGRADRLVFIDESAARTNLTRLRGRVRGPGRLHDHTPSGHWRTLTMLGSLRLDGRTTCLVIEGATDSEVFREYVRVVLGPTLRPGDIVVCDNLAAHRDTEAQKLIEARGAELRFLPAYSPDLNPIEMMWSKLKAHLRQAKARTDPDLLTAIRQGLQTVSSSDAHGFFRHAGYRCTIL